MQSETSPPVQPPDDLDEQWWRSHGVRGQLTPNVRGGGHCYISDPPITFGWYGADVSVQRWGVHFLTQNEPKCRILTKNFQKKSGVLSQSPQREGTPLLHSPPYPPMISGPPIFSTLSHHCWRNNVCSPTIVPSSRKLVVFDSVLSPHYMETWRHPQNHKYITYRIAIREGPSHGHG